MSNKGKKVLLITIDPSKRLKQILGLTDADAGNKHTVDHSNFNSSDNPGSFDAVLMSPTHTFEEMNL